VPQYAPVESPDRGLQYAPVESPDRGLQCRIPRGEQGAKCRLLVHGCWSLLEYEVLVIGLY